MVASIVIATMNRAYLLTRRSLKSALNQTFKDYEVIVVDDAGTDETEKLMKIYTKRHNNLSYYKLPQNRGLSFVRNYGIMKAQGECVVCLDDDNELMPEFLEKTINGIENFDAVGVGRLIKYNDFEDYAPIKDTKFQSIDWGWLIKREVFNEIQYDDELKANEDMDFGIRFFKKFRATYINEPLTIAFDIKNPKDSLSFPTQRELDGMTRFISKNLKEYTDKNELRYLYRLAGRKFYRGGHKLKGLNYFIKSFVAYPRFNSFSHLFFILFGWSVYDKFMTITEKYGAKKRKKVNSFG